MLASAQRIQLINGTRNRPLAILLLAILQNLLDAFISVTSQLEPGRICMIMSYSQIASSRPKLFSDAYVAL